MSIVVGFVVLLAALFLLGAGYEILFALVDRQRYKMPAGKHVDAGSHRLHVVAAGESELGAPTVILEAGVAGNSLDWQKVQPAVAEFTRVIAYDRAGYGWSDKGSDPRTPQQIVAELHSLLKNGAFDPPYILVGHSFGGIYTRLYLDTYPDEVVGLILVESSNPSMIKAINTEPELKRLRRVARFKRTGLVRLMLPRLLAHANHLDGAARKKYLAINMLDSDNIIREALPMYSSVVQLAEFVDVPLTVISREPFEEMASERKWQEYQKELADLSPATSHIYTESSSHYTALAEPDTVIRAIRRMYEQIQGIAATVSMIEDEYDSTDTAPGT